MTAPLSAAAVLALGYLLGAVPFAFILGSAAGVDLRTVGTGNVGAGNLRRTVGIGPAVAAAVLDSLKGLAPVIIARRLGFDDGVAAASGVAAVVGHNWSVYLWSRAGRGLATAVGVMVGLAPWLLVWTTLWAVAGWWIGGGFAGFLGWGLLPPVAIATGQPAEVVVATSALALVVIVRRMQGNVGDATDIRSRIQRAVWDTDRKPVIQPSEAEERTAS